jgi:hypothetical protein
MKKWPLPNLDGGKIRVNDALSDKNWYFREKDSFIKESPQVFDLPKGWGNNWPDLPNPDEDPSVFWLDRISLSSPRNPCLKETLLGYYMSWHIVGVSFCNETGRPPMDGEELRLYNNSLPKESRFGIHICGKSIEKYINKFSTEGLDQSQIPMYLEYCTFLTLIYVIAHEWGHYRSEVLSFQIGNLVRSISGQPNDRLSPSYLSYFVYKKAYPDSNFEEVFAEWASLKLGIFNYYIKKPAFATSIPNWPQVEATVKFMLTQAISRPNRNRPYSDIRHWVDFDGITRDVIMKRLSENKSSINRSVNDNVLIDKIRSFKNGKIIDLLMHNQIQFSAAHQFNGIVKSAPLTYPYEPDSSFYHFGDDECIGAQKPSHSDSFLQLGNPEYSNPQERFNSRIIKAIESLKEGNANKVVLPIKVFTELLPLDPVYFHV